MTLVPQNSILAQVRVTHSRTLTELCPPVDLSSPQRIIMLVSLFPSRVIKATRCRVRLRVTMHLYNMSRELEQTNKWTSKQFTEASYHADRATGTIGERSVLPRMCVVPACETPRRQVLPSFPEVQFVRERSHGYEDIMPIHPSARLSKTLSRVYCG